MSEYDDNGAPLPPTRNASVRNGVGGMSLASPVTTNGNAERREKKTGIVSSFFNKKG